MSTKRILSLVLALVMVLGTFGTVFAAPTASDKLAFLLENGVLKEGKADQNLKRRDSVVLLSRLMKEEAAAATHPASDKYDDIDDAFYNGYIGWATAKGYVNGKENAKFDPNGPLTAQAFATMLLRALGYQEGDKDLFDEAYAVGTDLGIFDDVEVGEKEVVTRGDMAAMTYNALGVKMNGQDKTLAEVLGIEMPVVEPEKVEIVSVRADNLREVKVELNTLKGLNLRALTNAKNYRTNAGEVKEVSLEENTVVLLLEDGKVMTQNGNYHLTIRDIKEIEVVEKAFKAYDNTDPVVEEVVVLGSMGIRVRMSEPVRNADERDFLLDGKTFVTKVTTNGRDITLIPYPYFKTFDKLGEQELTVLAQSDFAGYKSPDFRQMVDIKADDTKPVVENIEVTNNSVIVTFADEVYPPSVKANNVSWTLHSLQTVTSADEAKVLSGKRVEYVFKGAKELPRPSVVLTVKGVTNYSNITMDAHTQTVVVDSDFSRPEIISWSLVDDTDDTQGTLRLVFSKDLDEATALNIANYTLFEAQDYFPNLKKLDDDGKEVKVTPGVRDNGVKFERGSKKVVYVTFTSSTLKRGQNYILEVEGVRDNTALKNLMIAKQVPFTDGMGVGLVVWSATHDEVKNQVTLVFNERLERTIAEDPANYRFRTETLGFTGNVRKDYKLSELSNYPKVTLHEDGYVVTIDLPGNTRELNQVRVSSSIVTLDGLHRYDGRTDCGGTGADNWIGLGLVRNGLVSAKAIKDNTEIELAYNLDLVKLATNYRSHIQLVDGNGQDVTDKIAKIELDGNKVYLVLNSSYALVAGQTYTVNFLGDLALTKYGMGVCVDNTTVDPSIVSAPYIKANQTKVVVLGTEANPVVEVFVDFDQPMVDLTKVNVNRVVPKSESLNNLAINNATLTDRHFFEEAVVTAEDVGGVVSATSFKASFTGDAAKNLVQSTGGNLSDFDFFLSMDKNKPVKAVNKKVLVNTSVGVENLVLGGTFVNGRNVTINSTNLKRVDLNGVFGAGTVTVNVPYADVYVNNLVNNLVVQGISANTLHVLGTVNRLVANTDFNFETTGTGTVKVVTTEKTSVKVNGGTVEKDALVKVDEDGNVKAIEASNVTASVYDSASGKETKVTFEVNADVEVKDIEITVEDANVIVLAGSKENGKYVFVLKGEYTVEELTIEVK